MGSINYWLREPPEQDDIHYSESITDNDYCGRTSWPEEFDDLDLDLVSLLIKYYTAYYRHTGINVVGEIGLLRKY